MRAEDKALEKPGGDAAPEELCEVIESLSEDERGKIIRAVSKIEMGSFSSPLPPPQILRGYSEIVSDAPERLLRMAEEGQRADNSARDKMIDAQSRFHRYNLIRDMFWGCFFALLIILILGAGLILIFRGYKEQAVNLWGWGGIGAAALWGLSAYFGRHKQMDKTAD